MDKDPDQPPISERGGWTPEEAAEYLGVKRGWLMRFGIKPPINIPVVPVPKSNIRLFRKASLDKWLADNEQVGVQNSQFGRAARSKAAEARREKRRKKLKVKR